MSSYREASPPLFPNNQKFDGINWIACENIFIATCMREASGYLNGTIKWLTITTYYFYYVNISDVSGLSRWLPFIMLISTVYSKQRL